MFDVIIRRNERGKRGKRRGAISCPIKVSALQNKNKYYINLFFTAQPPIYKLQKYQLKVSAKGKEGKMETFEMTFKKCIIIA